MTDPLYQLFAFALDLYRAPLQFLPYVGIERPIPRGFGALLEALNKREDSEFWHDLSDRLKASPEQLRNAGMFLVKRLLFAEGTDHYRVLGLESRADFAQARERYRLLMALFHPDRNHRGDEWTEQYAPRINEAYNTLKNPEKKRIYDQGIGSEALWGDDVPPPGSAGHGRDEPRVREDLTTPEPPPGGGDAVAVKTKRPTFHIWAAVLLLGLIGWFSTLVYESGGLKLAVKHVGREVPERSDPGPEATLGSVQMLALPAGKEGGGITEGQPQTDSSTAAAAAPLAAVAKVEEVAPKPEEPAAAAATDEETWGATPEAGASAISVRQPDSAVEPPGPVLTQPRVDAECPEAGCGESDSTAPTGQAPHSEDRSVAVDSPVAEPTSSSIPPAQPDSRQEEKIVITQQDVDFLISRFIHAYEAGDMGEFAALFSRRAWSNKVVGRDRIAKQYGDLFRSTQRRTMTIQDLSWTPKADGVAKITFFVAIETERPGTPDPEAYLGDAEMLVYKDLERLKISKFVHRVGKGG